MNTILRRSMCLLLVVGCGIAPSGSDSNALSTRSNELLTPSMSSYVAGTTVSISYSGYPGNTSDWVAIAAAGSPATSFVQFKYLGGNTSGTLTFDGLPAGNYEARGFYDWFGTASYTVQESAAFTITPSTTNAMVTASSTAITLGNSVTATYSGLAATPTDWIGLSVAGSPDTSFESFAYTNGTGSGSVSLTPAMNGSYVLRAYNNNSYVKVAESAVITVGAAQQLTTDASTYQQGATITVNYNMLPGNPTDWIAIAAQGSPNTSFLTYQYITATSGTLTFTAPAPGTYEIRAFANNTYELLATSAAFTVASAPLPGTVTTDSTYSTTASITANYAALPGGSIYDWVTIAPAGSALTNYGQYIYVPAGQTSGSVTLDAVAAGSYVIRVFSNNGFTLLAESSTITVQETLSQ
jgi:hypothetical protein